MTSNAPTPGRPSRPCTAELLAAAELPATTAAAVTGPKIPPFVGDGMPVSDPDNPASIAELLAGGPLPDTPHRYARSAGRGLLPRAGAGRPAAPPAGHRRPPARLRTAVTDAGQRTLRMLSQTLRLPVFGTRKPLLKSHSPSAGFDPAFAHLLTEASATRPAPGTAGSRHGRSSRSG